MQIDFDALTLDEVEQIELISGVSIDQIMKRGTPKGRALKAIIYVVAKRTDPDYTIEQAGKLQFQEAAALLNGEPDQKKG